MANNIKGITIEIGGDTSPLQTALENVNKTSRDLQSELKEVNKQLKLDPENTVLLEQKQKLLAESITNTKEKLETLQMAEQKVQQQFEKGDISEEQYRALQREVIKTEQNLESLEKEAIKSNAALSKDEAVGNLKKIATTAGVASAAVGVAFVAMGKAAVDNADELQRQSDVTGLSAEKLQELQYVGNNLGVELDTITGAQAKLTKSMDAAKSGTGAQADAFKELGISVLDGNGHLKSANDVMEEAFTALGKVGNETERDALSMAIFGKSAMEMNPLIKAGGDEINRLSEEAQKNGAVMSNEAVSGLDAFGDTIDSLKSSILGSIGETLAGVMPQLQNILDGLMKSPQWIRENSTLLEVMGIIFTTITALIIAFNIQQALAASRMTLWSAVAGVGTTVTSALGTAFEFLIDPIGLTILAISAAISIGVLLYKNWDTVKAKAVELKNSIITEFNNIGTSVSNTWNSIKTTTSNIWNGIGTFFTGLWASIETTTESIWNGIKAFFTDVWTGIVTVVIAIVTPFVNKILAFYNNMKDGLATIMEGLKNYFSGIWEVIKNVSLGAVLLLIDLVTGNFTKLSSDAQYIWNNLKDAFNQIWQGIKQIFNGTLEAIAGFLKTEWDGIKNVTETVWNGIKTFFSELWTSIKNTATTAWNEFKTWITDFWNGIVQGAKDIWNGLITWFQELPGKLYQIAVDMFTQMKAGVESTITTVYDAVVNGITKAVDWITALPGEALQWGEDFITGFKNGILNAMSSLLQTVQNMANSIRSFLHFSRPDQGPLADYETWMPDFIEGLASGIENNKYKVIDAIKSISSDMQFNTTLKAITDPAADYYFNGYSHDQSNSNSENSLKSMFKEAVSNGGIKQTITVNSPKYLNPSEAARQTKNAMRQLAHEL